MDKQRDFEKGLEEYKAKKKQEQEKMIGIIQDAVGGCARNWASLIAEELLKYYQPKIPENAVVLTKEEYDDMFTFKTVGQEGKHCGFYNILDTVRKVERKETAEKFAERLKEQVLNFCGTVEENGYFERGKLCFCEDIDEICKEFTGEAK